ncbi:MAG TPA: hypothetical protein PKE31_15120 [Pseudomonadota bacterium]|nr:hypothetical protein [Pseudomonadota bacterium]
MRHHVIVALSGDVPAKVECLSCHKQHKYKGAPPGQKGSKPSSGKTVRSSAARSTTPVSVVSTGPHPLDTLLQNKGTDSARLYSPADRYAVGELVSHPNFGLGAVTAIPSPGKISVLFRDTTRLLLHERALAPAVLGSKLNPPPRREEAPHGPADRPPKVKSIL